MVSEQLLFTVWGYYSHAQPPTWRTRVSPFVWLLPLDLSFMGDSSSSYATAGIGLRVSGALKPHHHDKVETPLVGYLYLTITKFHGTSSGLWVTVISHRILGAAEENLWQEDGCTRTLL
jgi:hypothetical protein